MQHDIPDLPAALANAARVSWNNILERAPAPLAEQLETAAGTGPAAARSGGTALHCPQRGARTGAANGTLQFRTPGSAGLWRHPEVQAALLNLSAHLQKHTALINSPSRDNDSLLIRICKKHEHWTD